MQQQYFCCLFSCCCFLRVASCTCPHDIDVSASLSRTPVLCWLIVVVFVIIKHKHVVVAVPFCCATCCYDVVALFVVLCTVNLEVAITRLTDTLTPRQDLFTTDRTYFAPSLDCKGLPPLFMFLPLSLRKKETSTTSSTTATTRGPQSKPALRCNHKDTGAFGAHVLVTVLFAHPNNTCA